MRWKERNKDKGLMWFRQLSTDGTEPSALTLLYSFSAHNLTRRRVTTETWNIRSSHIKYCCNKLDALLLPCFTLHYYLHILSPWICSVWQTTVQQMHYFNGWFRDQCFVAAGLLGGLKMTLRPSYPLSSSSTCLPLHWLTCLTALKGTAL